MTVIDALDDPVEPWTAKALVSDAPAQLARDLRAAQAKIAGLETRLEAAERLADHDPLTGLFNRRGFERELARTLAACRRYGTDAALIYLDLDGFKAVNDRFGHAAGDDALQTVARALSAAVRESDVVARLGGDEFAVILSHAGRAAANAKARALAAAVESAPSGPAGSILLSYGVRVFEPGLQAEQMLAEADAAMFVRKGNRRRG